MNPSVRTDKRAGLWAAAVAATLTPGLAAQQHPNFERGYPAQQAFQVGEIDDVNLHNGNVTLSIPLGNSYPVGAGFSYRLHAVYNSKIWDFREVFNPQDGSFWSEALPSRLSNAGLGWSVSLGRLLDPNDPANDEPAGIWLYESPEGSQHAFAQNLHTYAPDGNSNYVYSRDATYVRLKLSGSVRVLEAPDGTKHSFETYATSKWRLTRIEDRFGNYLSIDYTSEPNAWKLTDSVAGAARTHYVRFISDPSGWYTTKVVSSVELETFGGGPRAIYSFTYAATTVRRTCQDNYPSNQDNILVPLLTRIGLPDGSAFQPTYYSPTHGSVCQANGFVKDIQLPPLGKIAWNYRTQGTSLHPCPRRKNWMIRSAAVASRTVYAPSGASLGTWTYSSVFSDPVNPPPPNACDPFFAPDQQQMVTVKTPLGDKTEHYFSVFPGTNYNSGNVNRREEYGLPFTRLSPDASGTRFLSARTYDCESDGSACVLLRTTYLKYEYDAGCSGPEDLPPACMRTNRRLASERVVYDNTAGVYADTDFSDFDGLSHYRAVSQNGSFPGSNVRSTTTDYNPDRGTYQLDPNSLQPCCGHDFTMLPTSSPWVLETFARRSESEGGQTEVEEFCFEPTGFLKRKRSLRLHTGVRDAKDVLVAYGSDATGNVISEAFYGGDDGGLATSADLCTQALPADAYWLQHTYAGGVRATSQYRAAGGGVPTGALDFKLLDRTIDGKTGLVATETDAAGVLTLFEYDAMARRLWEKASPGHDAWTQYGYTRATSASAPAQVTLTLRPNGSTTGFLAETRLQFDGFGRLAREERVQPGPTAVQTREYNAQGWLTALSEWQTGTPTKKTLYQLHDPFGRPQRIRPPEGASHDVDLIYFGVHAVVRRVRVGTAPGVETVAKTTEVYDRQGRLYRVREYSGEPAPPAEAINTEVITTYGYDVGNRLTNVSTTASVAGVPITQARKFVYDGRGFLLSEAHPEKSRGATDADPDVTYQDLDALGNARRRIDGPFDLKYVFDRAGRLLTIKEFGGLQRALKDYAYGDPPNTPCALCRGKVYQASRHNWVVPPWTPTDPEVDVWVRDTFTYSGRQGRLSDRLTLMSTGHEFQGSYRYHELGALDRVTYPRCQGTAVPCAAQTAGNPGPRNVDSTYTNGYLTKVGGYADSTGAIGYHPGGLVSQVLHNNQVRDTLAADANATGRPGSITVSYTPTSAVLWKTGAYAYDGGGNVVSMGPNLSNFSDAFSYDLAQRLLASTTYSLASVSGGTYQAYRQNYGFDAFGNLLEIETQVGGGPWVTRTTATVPSTNQLSAAGYDTAGNLTSWAGLGTLVYDPFGHVKYQNYPDVIYLYTAADERLERFEWYGSFPTEIAYFTLRDPGGRVLTEYKSAGGAQGTWTWQEDYVFRGEQLLASETPAGVRHFHLDHLGTPRLITNAAGAKVAVHSYYPFGEEITAGSQDTERLKFTGHERDGNAAGTTDDLDIMHARNCSPHLGRFFTVDPGASARALAPQSWNRYAYALLNPMKFVDPDGRETQLVVGGHTKDNVFGHVALAINGRVYSYGTRWVSAEGDWGVPLRSYLGKQNDQRQTEILTLDVTPEQEAALADRLDANNPYSQGEYSILNNSCVTVCEESLEEVGVLANDTGPLTIDYGGNELQAGAPSSRTPQGLAGQVREQGLVTEARTTGTETTSKPGSFWGTVKSFFKRLFR